MQHVEFIETKTTHHLRVHEDRFQLTPKRGWLRLQRLCFWVLAKLECHSVDEVIEYTRHRIDTDDLVRKIHMQRIGLLEHYNREGRRLLIGAEDFSKLMGSPEIRNLMSFDAKYHSGREIMGMKVTVVPWMKGMLVLPKSLD